MTRALIFLCISLLAAAEPALRPHWKAGDSFVVEMTRSREDSRNPKMAGSSTTPVTIKVLETGEQGSVVDWVPGETKLSNPEAAKNPMVAKSMEAVKGLHLELTLDEDGTYTGLRNETQVAAQLEKMLKVMLSEMPSTPEVQTGIRQMLSPNVLIAAAAKDAQMYFSLGGVELRKGLELEAPVEVPSPFGGTDLKANIRTAVTRLEGNEVTVRISLRYDPASLAEMTQNLMKQAGAKMTAEQLASVPPMDLADETEGTAEIGLGLPVQMKVTRRVSMGSQMKRTDEWGFRLVKRPAR